MSGPSAAPPAGWWSGGPTIESSIRSGYGTCTRRDAFDHQARRGPPPRTPTSHHDRTTPDSPMTDRLRRRRRLLVAPIALLGALAVALTAPMPSVPDDDLTTVRAEVADRLPGWRVDRLEPSWEGGYTVVTSCAGLELDFQLVPDHGLPAEDAWVQ